jgi:tetratricopeptide (TPR) repeat protein
LAHSAQGKHLQAISLIEQALHLNPPDNQGLRYLLASECLSAKQYERAKSLFTQYMPEHPALGYELAWLHLQTHQSAQAIAALRKAWLDEPAIGHRIMKPVKDRKSPASKSTHARTDADAYAHRWQSDPAAMAFMQWLKAQPIIQDEQKQAKALRQALNSTNNLFKHAWLLAKQWRLRHRTSAGNDQFELPKALEQEKEHGHA